MNTLDSQQINKLLPHRFPFLLVDKVLDYTPSEHIVAVKNVTFNESCFQGHFPGNPIFPGVLIIEAMAQAAALLGCVSGVDKPNVESIYYLVGVDKARFKKEVHPGDQLILNARFIKLRRNIWKFSAAATADEGLVASAEILTTIVDA